MSVTRTLDRISFLCLRLKQDVKAETEVTVRTQKEIHGQKQQVEKLTAQALKITNARSESLTADSSGLKGGERSVLKYFSLRYIKQTRSSD